ncbi:MAG: Fic family protein [Geobacteraceae bacterium]|nr:Fic family protein [Geobacteraceae bacterium]
MTDRYDTSNQIEDQYEPDSDGTVLRNLLGITSPEEMEIHETADLWIVQGKLFEEISVDQSFTVNDICQMHKQWLGKIYTWAGVPRGVNLSKGGFDFAVAQKIPTLLDEFPMCNHGNTPLSHFDSHDDIAHALAEVHVELMLIHPFREGNGRLGRMLATLMALQAGLPQLEFSEMIGFRREEYFASVRAGLDRNYQPMKKMFSDVIERSVWLWEES